MTSPINPQSVRTFTSRRCLGGMFATKYLRGIALVTILFVIYQINGDLFPGHDLLVSLLQAESLVREGDLSFTATEIPELLDWKYRTPDVWVPIPITFMDADLRELFQREELTGQLDRTRIDAIVPTVMPGRYTNTFAPGAAVFAAPFLALVEWIRAPLSEEPLKLYYLGKLVASLAVAFSALFVYLTSLRFVSPGRALLIGAVYGLATSVWSISSQGLWQHGPNEFFLTFATYQLTRIREGCRHAAASGLGYAAATCCRPTSVLVFFAVAIYLLWYERRALAVYLLAASPLALALASYNLHYFGSPFRFGQMALSAAATRKTGAPTMWQTPWPTGMLGILLSPSRGIFIYSPLLLVALYGHWRFWRDDKYQVLRPMILAVIAIWCVEAKHYDWWGGWSFGYRHIVDTVPLLSLGLIPIFSQHARHPARSLSLGILVIYSIGVQVLGTWAYDVEGWNARKGYLVTSPETSRPVLYFDLAQVSRLQNQPDVRIESVIADVDDPRYRHRLWSWQDNQLAYYLQHFHSSRAFRRQVNQLFVHLRAGTLSETHLALARVQRQAGERARATQSLQRALTYNPSNGEAQLLLRQLTQ